MEAIFREQRDLVNYFFDHLDCRQVERFFEKVANCKGMIYMSGMGKSGIIAQTICAMLVSTGAKAMFLDPVNALHGDVGVVDQGDLLVLFSKSGQSKELMHLIPASRNKGADIIAVVSNPDGLLAKQCQDVVVLPLDRELCPFDLAPTTSSIIQLIFGNTVVAYLMRKSGLTKEAYALNHPAGRIGKRLTVRVEDVMRPLGQIAVCNRESRLMDQLSNMSAKRCGCLLVVDNYGVLQGIFTDGDLRRMIQKYQNQVLERPMYELMTRKPTVTMDGVMAYDAMKEMERVDADGGKKRVKELPVVDGDLRVVGLLTLHDLVEFGL